MRLNTIINGVATSLETSADTRLIDLLRGPLGLTGTKEGCAEGECGACTVLLDGQAVNACLVLAPQVEGRTVRTIEGLSPHGAPNRLQAAFIECGAVQCGFCTPGMLMAATALLERNAHPAREEIARALAGNLCRCTGYAAILDAVERAAQEAAP